MYSSSFPDSILVKVVNWSIFVEPSLEVPCFLMESLRKTTKTQSFAALRYKHLSLGCYPSLYFYLEDQEMHYLYNLYELKKKKNWPWGPTTFKSKWTFNASGSKLSLLQYFFWQCDRHYYNKSFRVYDAPLKDTSFVLLVSRTLM